MQAFVTDIAGRLLISKDVLIENKIYTSDSYRTQKSKKRLTEVTNNGAPYVFADSLTPQTRDKVKRVFSNIKGEYAALLRTIDNAGENCVPVAVQFTAESLHINESFIRSAIETHS